MKIRCSIVYATRRNFEGGLTWAVLFCILFLFDFVFLIHARIGTGRLNDLFNPILDGGGANLPPPTAGFLNIAQKPLGLGS